MNNSPRVKSFHSETFFYYLLGANPTICLDQELIYQLFDFFITFIFLKTSSLHSTTAVDLEGFVIRIFFNLEEAYWENFLLFAIIFSILHIVCLSRFFSSLFIRFAVFDIWKLIQLYAAVYQVCMQALSILLWSSSTWPFFIILVLIQCTDSYQKCIHRQYVFPFFLSFSFFYFYFLFFVCQTWRIASLPFDATSSHAFACYCVEQQKTVSITNSSLF